MNGYFSALDTATPEIRERNIYLYKDITFKAPVLILGWVAQGKNGTLNGTMITKRGIIIEYAAHYLEDDGSFTRIYNTDKKSKSKKVKTLVYLHRYTLQTSIKSLCASNSEMIVNSFMGLL